MKDIINNIKNKFVKNIKKSFTFLNKENRFNLVEVIAIMIITVIFGMLVGGVLMYRKGSLNIGVKKELNDFVDTYTEILNEYYTDVETDELLEAGIDGMIKYLGDPYSTFMDEEATTAFNEKINGEYVGIGTEIVMYQDGRVEIQNAYEDGPAYEAGIRNGDIIIKVDDVEIKDKSLTDITSLVKGKEGTKVKITVLRGEEEKTFEVKRKAIEITSVESELLEYNNSKIGYIIISIFANNTYKQFKDCLSDLESKGIDSLVIDVRSNSGGYLTTVTDILSLFMKKGEVIYQLKTKDKVEEILDKTNDKRDYKISVLINGGSASASEVLTSCLMEKHDAYVVGTKSYGKGTVQKTYNLSNGKTIKYTFQEWLTANGNSINEKGIMPQYEVTFMADDIESLYDSQLQKALDLLTENE